MINPGVVKAVDELNGPAIEMLRRQGLAAAEVNASLPDGMGRLSWRVDVEGCWYAPTLDGRPVSAMVIAGLLVGTRSRDGGRWVVTPRRRRVRCQRITPPA